MEGRPGRSDRRNCTTCPWGEGLDDGQLVDGSPARVLWLAPARREILRQDGGENKQRLAVTWVDDDGLVALTRIWLGEPTKRPHRAPGVYAAARVTSPIPMPVNTRCRSLPSCAEVGPARARRRAGPSSRRSQISRNTSACGSDNSCLPSLSAITKIESAADRVV
jgi:hypothetical protein